MNGSGTGGAGMNGQAAVRGADVQGRIALFDSGAGGLALLAECVRRFPCERYLYYGDNANAPYGGRAEGEIVRLASRAFDDVARTRPRACVLACNTVTAVCIDALRARSPFPVFGIEPALRPASAKGGRVLLLATRATLASARLQRLLRAAEGAGADVVRFCPSWLAGAVESHLFDLSAVTAEGLPAGPFAAVVLGCTHYALVKEAVARRYGCPVFDGLAGTADHIGKELNICSKKPQNGAETDVIFAGSGKIVNEKAFFHLKNSTNICS